jgi:hypothetical protein
MNTARLARVKRRRGVSLARTARGLLPHDVARAAVRVLTPGRFAELMALREATLRPFLDHRCLFVHIPKCAGTSVTEALFAQPVANHRPIAQFKLIFTEQEFQNFFKFTFVRNPWDRLVSIYYYLKDGGRSEIDQEWARRLVHPHPSFRDFVLSIPDEDAVLDAYHLRPQWTFLCMSRNEAPEVDFIGRFERLDEDFDLIRQRLRLSVPLGRVNRGRSRPQAYRDEYDAETAARVSQIYRRDIELFGYAF